VRIAKLVGIGHYTWGVVRFDLDGAASGSPAASTRQILSGRDSITGHHMAQTNISLIVEHALIWALRLTALRLRLAIVVEVVVSERHVVALLGKILLNLLILTH